MVTCTLKILQLLLQDFKSVFVHLGTFCIKGLISNFFWDNVFQIILLDSTLSLLVSFSLKSLMGNFMNMTCYNSWKNNYCDIDLIDLWKVIWFWCFGAIKSKWSLLNRTFMSILVKVPQPVLTCSKSTIETPEQCLKSVQS